MTYLIIELASCLFFAQLLGLLLGWLLWGFVSKQRKKEILLLRSRLAEIAEQSLRPGSGAGARGSVLALGRGRPQTWLVAGKDAAMADLPPLAPLPPEPPEPPERGAEPVPAAVKNEGLIAELRQQIEKLRAEKESAVAAPDAAEAPAPSGLDLHSAELADLRERLEKALQERAALAAELDSHKSALNKTPEQLAELRESLNSKEALLAEQVARVESLLWRVAELEPFATTVPHLQGVLKGKDTEIASLKDRNAELDSHIRTLLGKVAGLEPLANRVAELNSLLETREAELQEKTASEAYLSATVSRMQELAAEKEAQLSGIRQRMAELEDAAARLQASREEGESSIAALKGRMTELESMAAQAQEAESQVEAKHQADLVRLKVNSARRIRRLKQSITSF